MDKQEMQFEAAIWRSHISALPYDPSAAIVKKWRAENKAGRYLGVPVTMEMPLPNGHVGQGFSSGARLVWVGGDNVEVR